MERDPATGGAAIILFAIAVMIFGATTGNPGIAGAAGFFGLLIAIVGLVNSWGRGPGRGG
ncbi:MAG: hypothetical protein C0498_03000 [Anaerolinea sp.]|jgi:hypothetical protein|nr:hypothetical protein [Anaerolinea sp.]